MAAIKEAGHMCSSFEGRLSYQELDRMVRSKLGDWSLGACSYTYHVGDRSPVLKYGSDGYLASEMFFKLVPSWSKTKEISYATHNARILGEDKNGKPRKVYEAPAFRGAYSKGKILVPMSSFVEPAYWGRLQGNMLRFQPKGEGMLFCAAIYDEWLDRTTGEIFAGYSLLVHEPYQTVLENGHHRSPFFVSTEVFEEWVHIDDNQLSFDFLLANREQPKLDVSVQRSMVEGWKKRKSMNIKKAEAEGLDVKKFG